MYKIFHKNKLEIYEQIIISSSNLDKSKKFPLGL